MPTSMPAWARATAVALPMPESEAVTMARWGLNSLGSDGTELSFEGFRGRLAATHRPRRSHHRSATRRARRLTPCACAGPALPGTATGCAGPQERGEDDDDPVAVARDPAVRRGGEPDQGVRRLPPAGGGQARGRGLGGTAVARDQRGGPRPRDDPAGAGGRGRPGDRRGR